MSYLIRFLMWLSHDVRVIPDRINPANPYLTRWYLIGGRRHKWFTLCLHQFHCSDPTDEHCHPFPWATLILSGGYAEYMSGKRYWRRPGTMRLRRAKTFHRIELDKSTHETFTLFAMGPRWRDWGFNTKRGWVPHEKYLEEIAKHV